jgi:asparagine synthase (glutamine-hydrolysing)
MSEKLHVYDFDKYKDLADQEMYFGCGIICNTPESLLENMPRMNEGNSLLIAADAIIDNRVELLEAFQIDPSQSADTTDSDLILRAYEKWGHSCPKHLIGDYAFAIWDPAKKELFLARDALGTRSLYYMHEKDAFAFCTVEMPLLGVLNKSAELNEKWIADFLAIDGIQHQLTFEETVYQGIYQLLPAHYGVLNDQGFQLTKYWDPLKDVQPIHFDNDEQYVQLFNSIFAEAVSCRIRSAGETGIMLSGGMDSGSIACVAAKQMAETNRSLHAFTSIPVESFNEKPDSRTVYNESREVELVVDAYRNIDVTYCRFEGKNALSDIDDLIGIFSQPYKVFRNMSWYHPMLKEAVNKNCKIMLNGQVGNSTISYGDFKVNLLTLYRAGKWKSMFMEIFALSRLLNVPVKKVFKLAGNIIIPYRVQNWRDRIRHRDFDRFQNVIVKRSLIQKWELENRLDQVDANRLTPRFLDYEEDKKLRISLLHFNHIGAIETKLSLANRITIRDPARDRRVFEFCLSIPHDQYVRNGNERYLLRRAMKGILPDPIRANSRTMGIQSADWIHRLNSDWELLLSEVDRTIASKDIEPYVDMNKIRHLREQLGERPEAADESSIRMALTAVILSRFISNFNRTNVLPAESSNHQKRKNMNGVLV